MRLVLVDSRDDEWFKRQYNITDDINHKIEKGNKLLTDYMRWSNDNSRVSIHKNRNDYMALNELLKMLESGICREIFKTVKSDMLTGVPLNFKEVPLSEFKDLLTSMLKSSTIQQLNKNLRHFISVGSHKGHSDAYGHLFTFVAYDE